MDDFLRRLFGTSGKPHPLDGDSGLPAPNHLGDLALPETVRPRVLAIIHNPTIRPRGGQKAQAAYRWDDPDKLAQGYIDDLRHASYGYLDYQIAERIEFDAFPLKQDGFCYTDESFDRAWKARHRPPPKPVAQDDPALPPRGVMTYSEDGARVRCHVCGKWLRSLNAHLRLHGLDAASYKEAYDLPRTASLLPPATQARYREAALARDQGEVGRNHLPPSTPRPAGLSSRLGTRIAASARRRGIYTRGGERTK